MENKVGTMIYGFCNGFFGRDSYEPKRIEAAGHDWIVARGLDSGEPQFALFGEGWTKSEMIELLEAWSKEPEYAD